jgi:hypothetical protein
MMAFSCKVFAGGPVNTPNIEEVKQVEKPKLVAVEFAYDDMNKVAKHWTVGIGFGGTTLAGIVEKDGFGYPKCEYGVTCLAGYSYTRISGQPTPEQIKDALESIRSKFGAFVEGKNIPSLVREELGINELNYVEFGTVAAVLPINYEMGKMWIVSDNVRTRIGFGFPTIISIGVNIDF